MQRYFCEKVINNGFILSDDDSYHIKKVMRMEVKDLIEVVCNKQLYICKIIDLDNLVRVDIKETINENNEFPIKVIICQSLVNEQKMDLILQKCTELGATDFLPYKAVNSVVKDNGKWDKKVIRWQRIVKEASEQSKREIIPEVHEIIDLNELKKFGNCLKIICTVNIKTKNIKNILQNNKSYDTIIIVVGPEGGFDRLEEKELIDCGFIPASLGGRVLRTETAAVAFLSMLNYEWMV